MMMKMLPCTSRLLRLVLLLGPAMVMAQVEKTLEMVVTAHPLATAAGESILQAGGTAADAMVAVQAVLGLVEPQSSGLGGGAFVVYYDAATSQVTTFDGRETAPASATEDLFVNVSGFFQAWQSGLSVGVPAVPRLLETVHQKYGTLPWNQDLFQEAIDLATDGYEVSERTAGMVNRLLGLNAQSGFDCVRRFIWRDPTAFDYFINVNEDNNTLCSAVSAGSTQTNPAYAETLQALAQEGGVDAFYSGAMAEAIVNVVQNDPSIPGGLTVADLQEYKVIERPPVCLRSYKGTKQVCGMGPPSSGGLAVGQIMGILDQLDVTHVNENSTKTVTFSDPLAADAIHYFTQANRLAFADRDQYVGDPDFVSVPIEGMLSEAYLAERASLIGDMDMGVVDAGVPPGLDPSALQGADTRKKTTGTSHVSIVDRCGNALSMTTTVESPFGNGVMVNGFLLNNELTDFSFAPTDEEGNPIANRPGSRKRPRSSMAPTIILDENGMPELLTGSPGGSSIIGYTAQSIFNIYDSGLHPQSAAGLPHYLNNNAEVTSLELPIANVTMDYDVEELVESLEARGHAVTQVDLMESGLGIIHAMNDMLLGGADPRRDGTVGGADETDDTDVSFCTASTPVEDVPSTDTTETSTDTTETSVDAGATEEVDVDSSAFARHGLSSLLLLVGIAIFVGF